LKRLKKVSINENALGVSTMKLGCKTVLFGGFDLETALKNLARAGYEGVGL
jgi:hypothetical protein